MNKTETLAYEWLRIQGYSNIVFHPHSTPDFTTNNSGFEVKRLDRNTMVFSLKQFQELKDIPSTHMLIYTDSDKFLIEFPFHEIQDGKRQWKGVKIRVDHPRNNKLKPIAISESTYNKLMAYRDSNYNLPMDGLIRKLLDTADKYDRMTHRGDYSRKKESK